MPVPAPSTRENGRCQGSGVSILFTLVSAGETDTLPAAKLSASCQLAGSAFVFWVNPRENWYANGLSQNIAIRGGGDVVRVGEVIQNDASAGQAMAEDTADGERSVIETAEPASYYDQHGQLQFRGQIVYEIISLDWNEPTTDSFDHDNFDPALQSAESIDNCIDVDFDRFDARGGKGHQRSFQPKRIDFVDCQAFGSLVQQQLSIAPIAAADRFETGARDPQRA
jgi:hypothetical protein